MSGRSSLADGLAEAADRLRGGGLVAFPTETVYGLGADATNDAAVARIFEAKGRPRFNPLIVHVPELAAAENYGVFDARATKLAEAFWPGPLSLVVPRVAQGGISLLCSAGLDTLALRAPAHPLAQALLYAVDRPLAAPSANRSGRISPTRAAHVLEELGDRLDMILDGGPCAVGVESTVLDCSGAEIVLLRHGGLDLEAIEAVVGPVKLVQALASAHDAARSSPGLLASHYAPERPVRLQADSPRPGEALLGFGPSAHPVDYQLSETGDLIEAAARLFAGLRALDIAPFASIAVMPIPETGLGQAINDRLRRAAAPR